MSEHITHVAVYDDTVRLMKHKDRFTQAFIESTSKEFESGWVASGSNGNHIWAVPILEQYRAKYKAGDRSSDTLRKISAAIGWITHRAADLVVKPVLRSVGYENHPVYNEQEQSAYHDIVIFKKVFKDGRYSPNLYEPLSPATFEPLMQSHPQSKFYNTDELETAVSHFYLNELLKQHSFIADTNNFDQWFDLFMDSKQKFSEDLDMYINANTQPNKTKFGKYVTNYQYYTDNDQIIRLVRSIQDGKPDTSIRLEVAIDAAKNQSMYARILANSYTMLCYASDFFDGAADKDALYDVLNMYGNERK